MNSVQPPNVLKALGVLVVGTILVVVCRAFFEGWGTFSMSLSTYACCRELARMQASSALTECIVQASSQYTGPAVFSQALGSCS